MTTARRALGRPRQVSDDEIYTASLLVLADFGAIGLTLARVAARVGVTAAAIRQRYGSKRGLLVAVARQRVTQSTLRFEMARATIASPLDALQAAFVAELGLVQRPEQVAHMFSAYSELVSDPEIAATFGEEVRAMTDATERLLREARAAGELHVEPTRELAAGLVATAEGTMLLWALSPEGDLAERVRSTIRTVLAASAS